MQPFSDGTMQLLQQLLDIAVGFGFIIFLWALIAVVSVVTYQSINDLRKINKH